MKHSNEIVVAADLRGGKWEKTYEESRRVYDISGISPTLPTFGGGNQEIKIMVNEDIKLFGGVGEKKSNGGQQFFQQDRIYCSDGVAMCLPSQIPKGSYMYAIEKDKNCPIIEDGGKYYILYKDKYYRIRRLTPKECVRLMDFDDSDYEAMSQVNSNSQIYRQCGNSICVGVLERILKELM